MAIVKEPVMKHTLAAISLVVLVTLAPLAHAFDDPSMVVNGKLGK